MAEWLQSVDIDGWTLLFAALTLIATWIAAWLARKGVRRLLARVPLLSETMQTLIVRVVSYSIVIVGIGVALSFFGASVQPILAAAFILVVILVLVLRGIADNFAAGVVLQTRRPIAIGDEIESEGVVGTVIELNGRSVVVRTADGQELHLPNAEVLQNPLANNTAHGARRSEVQVRVDAHGLGQDELRAAISAAASGAGGVHGHESVTLHAVTRGVKRDIYRVQFWHHPLHGVTVRSEVVDAIAEELAARDLRAVVTSDIPPASVTPSDEI
ncbi:MAG: mechanosensitive ion channel family protein [Actinomycetota bacterium]|nr:mechanosensitive ion channel family protein [Actinomycetota bacterium]